MLSKSPRIFAVVAMAALVGAMASFQPAAAEPDAQHKAGAAHSHADGTGHAPHAAAPAAKVHSHDDGTTHSAHAPKPATGAKGGHSHGGKIVDLGKQTAGAFTLAAKLEGALVAGKESVFLVEASPGAAALRLWVGDEKATGSRKAKAEGGPTKFHAHVLVPATLNEKSRLWLEVQDADGKRSSTQVLLPTAAAPKDTPKKVSGAHSHGGTSHSH